MPKSTRFRLLAILLLSVFLRLGVALYLGDTVPAGKDEQSYSSSPPAWRPATATASTGRGTPPPANGRTCGAVRYGIMHASTTVTGGLSARWEMGRQT